MAHLASLALALAPVVPAAAQSHNDVYVPFDELPIAGDPGTNAILNGSAVVASPGATTSLLSTGGGLTLLQRYPLRGAVTAEVTASGAGDFSQVVTGPLVVLPTVIADGGIAVVPVLAMNLLVEGHAEPGMRLSAVAEFTADVALPFGTIQEPRLLSEPFVRVRAGAPELSPGQAAELHVTVDALLFTYIAVPGAVFGGPAAQLIHGFDVEADTAADPWWSADSRFEVLGGLLPALQELDAFTFTAVDAGEPYPLLGVPSSRWSRAWDLGGPEEAISLLRLADGTGDLALVGNTSGVGSVAWLSRLTADGELLWENENAFQANGLLRPEAMHATSDGGLLVGSVVGLGGGMRADRFDGTGASAWSRLFTAPGNLFVLGSLCLRPDGGAVAVGSAQQSLDRKPLVVWISPAGDVESAVRVNLGPGVGESFFADVAPTPDGGWACTGYAYSNAAGLGSRDALLVGFTASKQVAFARAFGSPGFDDAHGLAVSEDGTLAVAGSFGSGVPLIPWLALFGPTGELSSSSHYAPAGGGLVNQLLVDVAPIEGGGFAVVGQRGLAAETDTWLFQVDGRGMPVWWKTVHGAGLDAAGEVRALDDGFLLAGRTDSTSAKLPATSDFWAARTSADGMLRFDPASGFDASNPPVIWLAGAPAVAALSAELAPLLATSSAAVFVPLPTVAGVIVLSL